jgi:GT2 family glycosyltransferase
LRSDSSIDALYTDQAYIDANGESVEPFFKPDWSPEFFRGVMYAGHLLVVRLTLARELGGFDSRFDRVQDFEFMLRLSEATAAIHHLRKILYYWRRIPGSVAFHGDEKGAIEPLQAAAVNEHLSRCRIAAVASPHPALAHRLVIDPKDRSTFPKVAIMVRENTVQPSALRSLLDRSSYPNFAVSLTPGVAAQLDFTDERIQVCDPVTQGGGEEFADYVVLMDGGLEVVTPDWIERLLFYCEQRGVGCAAPVLVQRDGSVWHAGLVLDADQLLDSPLRGLPADTDGYAGSLSCAREVSAVSGECLMISASLLREFGGSQRFYVSALYRGADLSLQALVHGRRNIVTPRARLLKRQSMKCEPDSQLDRALFADRWRDLLRKGDPFYNAGAAQASPLYADAEPAGTRA